MALEEKYVIKMYNSCPQRTFLDIINFQRDVVTKFTGIGGKQKQKLLKLYYVAVMNGLCKYTT